MKYEQASKYGKISREFISNRMALCFPNIAAESAGK